MQTTIYIDGIHCQSCVALLTMDLEDLDGVNEVNINSRTGETTIEYDENRVPFYTIRETITNCGEYSIK